MIKINLLPKKDITQWAALVEQGVSGIIVIVLVTLGLVGWTAYLKGEVKDLDHKIASIKSELKELEEDEAKIEEMKKTEAIIQKRIDVIKKLEKRKTGPVRMLDEVSKVIPEKLWLKDLRNKGALLTLDGIAIDNETVALFMTRLEGSDQFENIELKVSKEKKLEDFKFKEFSLTCVVKVLKDEVKEQEGQEKKKGKKKREKP
jgi:type IV pilus assembly protein PilN